MRISVLGLRRMIKADVQSLIESQNGKTESSAEERAVELYELGLEREMFEEVGAYGFKDPIDAVDAIMDFIENEIADDGEMDPDSPRGQAIRDALWEEIYGGLT